MLKKYQFSIEMSKKHSSKKRINNIIKETPLKRIGTTKDVRNLVEFLASDKASYISGETIFITGGRYIFLNL